MAFIIKPGKRTYRPVVACVWGGSGSGKTVGGLRVARGLAGPNGKIGVIDTEYRRALDQYGLWGGHFDHIDLEAPYSGERFIDAFQSFEFAGGYDVILIDSMSHFYKGEGGFLDQAANGKTKSGAPLSGISKWTAPKQMMQRIVTTILRSRLNVVLCIRAKPSTLVERDQNNKEVYTQNGLMPEMDKDIIFETFVSILLGPDQKPMIPPDKGGLTHSWSNRHFVNTLIPAIKGPTEIIKVLRPGEYLTEELGDAIRRWQHAVPKDVLGEARLVSGRGAEAYKAWWGTITPQEKKLVASIHAEMKQNAINADAAAAQAKNAQVFDDGEEGIQQGDESGQGNNEVVETPVDPLAGGFDIPATSQPSLPAQTLDHASYVPTVQLPSQQTAQPPKPPATNITPAKTAQRSLPPPPAPATNPAILPISDEEEELF